MDVTLVSWHRWTRLAATAVSRQLLVFQSSDVSVKEITALAIRLDASANARAQDPNGDASPLGTVVPNAGSAFFSLGGRVID
jgi:hypothetical protein